MESNGTSVNVLAGDRDVSIQFDEAIHLIVYIIKTLATSRDKTVSYQFIYCLIKLLLSS